MSALYIHFYLLISHFPFELIFSLQATSARGVTVALAEFNLIRQLAKRATAAASPGVRTSNPPNVRQQFG
jgi:hypothetical protein